MGDLLVCSFLFHSKTVSVLPTIPPPPNLLVSSSEVLSLEREVFPVCSVISDPPSQV